MSATAARPNQCLAPADGGSGMAHSQLGRQTTGSQLLTPLECLLAPLLPPRVGDPRTLPVDPLRITLLLVSTTALCDCKSFGTRPTSELATGKPRLAAPRKHGIEKHNRRRTSDSQHHALGLGRSCREGQPV
ncbi:hypothetical protein GGTG_01583 [Gaeumannomyces tritici R3-111a-1]|uniref:Uncharacterized protein n=1 Tax=Gaeumannomyces tritici (strain R3-111a-1) TaxID=644352 RepID=J3NK01_GAET3|nr:hypothetical protein GGTG_01583 [Gaeumannomyces tritici R3-111a-1]EJT81605.1 hypothetical protein GGTG_01583 [Gaeumannomyces tritici R3-111a-1]